MTEYTKLSIPRPLFDRLKAARLEERGFRSPTDAATHAIRVFLDGSEKGAA